MSYDFRSNLILHTRKPGAQLKEDKGHWREGFHVCIMEFVCNPIVHAGKRKPLDNIVKEWFRYYD